LVVGKKTEQCQRLAKLVCPGFLYYDYQQLFVLAAFTVQTNMISII